MVVAVGLSNVIGVLALIFDAFQPTSSELRSSNFLITFGGLLALPLLRWTNWSRLCGHYLSLLTFGTIFWRAWYSGGASSPYLATIW